MVTGRVVLTTITKLVPQHKEPAPPVTTVRKQTPLGEDPGWDTWSSHVFRAWGRASNTYAANMVYRPTSRETGLSNNF